MELVVTTKEELISIMEEAVANVVSRQERSEPAEGPDIVDAAGAIEFMAINGYKISIHSIYKKTQYNSIPYRKIGNQLSFSKRELLKWMESQNASRLTPHTNSALEIARSAHRQKK